jgi:hypothetical protein
MLSRMTPYPEVINMPGKRRDRPSGFQISDYATYWELTLVSVAI